MERMRCLDGGWVMGAERPFPMDATIRHTTSGDGIPCNQLFCKECKTPVKHLDGFRITGRIVEHEKLYDSLNPDDWIDFVTPVPEYRLYFCKCSAYSTPGGSPAPHLDSSNIDGWACAGHPNGAN